MLNRISKSYRPGGSPEARGIEGVRARVGSRTRKNTPLKFFSPNFFLALQHGKDPNTATSSKTRVAPRGACKDKA